MKKGVSINKLCWKNPTKACGKSNLYSVTNINMNFHKNARRKIGQCYFLQHKKILLSSKSNHHHCHHQHGYFVSCTDLVFPSRKQRESHDHILLLYYLPHFPGDTIETLSDSHRGHNRIQNQPLTVALLLDHWTAKENSGRCKRCVGSNLAEQKRNGHE